MHPHLITALLAALALVAGVVVTGILGDQGRGLDPLPFAVGLVAAGAVVVLRRKA
ncbi:hypothetical protein GCM10027418_02480 [Mariniluteicoccus endophyticus]